MIDNLLDSVVEIYLKHGFKSYSILLSENNVISVQGRLIYRRLLGSINFFEIQDSTSRIQFSVKKENFKSDTIEKLTSLNIGDILFVSGFLRKTKYDVICIYVSFLNLIVKSQLKFPDKWSGLKERNFFYTKRYLDLIINSTSRRRFLLRTHILKNLRKFFIDHNFLEVETPILNSIPSGAIAKPFKTYSNILHCDLFLRIAPELYLKKLIVGGFDRIFELSKNFRNEGLSASHHPEFTMLEFYAVNSTYNDLMTFTENLFKSLALALFQTTGIFYQGIFYDFSKPFLKISFKDAIIKYNCTINNMNINCYEYLLDFCKCKNINILGSNVVLESLQESIFEHTVVQNLKFPTFIIDYPVYLSPLAKRKVSDISLTDRFELYLNKMEFVNGFSELTDHIDQKKRLLNQTNDFFYDESFITALAHGMPTTAGEGIGIDRLIMLFTNAVSIKDVILFPTF